MATDIGTKAAGTFDPLDMNNYKIEKLPKMQKSKFEIWMARLGGPLAIAAFVWICWFCHIGFIDNLDQSGLAATAQKRLGVLGLDGFIRANYAMLAIFVASLILWMTEALPNYLTSLLLILGVVQCDYSEGSPGPARPSGDVAEHTELRSGLDACKDTVRQTSRPCVRHKVR